MGRESIAAGCGYVNASGSLMIKRLTPDSRAPAKQGEGWFSGVSLGGKEKSKKGVADDVCEHKLRNISPT